MNPSFLWGAAIVLLPLYVRLNAFNDVRICKNIFLVFLTVVSMITTEPLLVRNTRLTFGLLGLAVIAFFNHVNFYTGAALEQTVCFLAGLALIDHLSRHIFSLSLMRNAVITAGLIQSLIVFLNYFGFNPYNPSVPAPYVMGSLGQETLSGALLACTAPAFLFSSAVILLPIVIAATIMTHSIMSIASLAVGLLAAAVLSSKGVRGSLKYVLGAVIFLALFAVARPTEYFSDHQRFTVWLNMGSKFLDASFLRELFGHGLGYVFDTTKNTFGLERFTYAHNEYIEAIMSFGVVGAGLIAYLLWILKDARTTVSNSRWLGSLIAIGANAIGNFTTHVSSIALIGIVSYALLIQNLEGKNGDYCY